MKKLLSFLMLIVVLACNNSNTRERPISVPKEAIWKGGIDGGCWILFIKISENKIEANIYSENGDLLENGVFKKQGNCKIPPNILKEKIVGFDGASIVTNENCSFKK